MPLMFDERINKQLLSCIEKEGIKNPTDIQHKAIPKILDGLDIIGLSNTGTGKTLAYLLPIINNINPEIKTPQAIILTPTHELAAQVYKQAKVLCDSFSIGISPCLLIGGANIKRQLEVLKEKPRIVIGSAGRILELIKMKKLSAHNVKTIVIDEADRLLDTHNIDSINSVIKCTLRDRQLLFFSASLASETLSIAKQLGKDPLFVKAENKNEIPQSIEHFYFTCEKRDKIEVVRKIIHGEGISKAIVFLNNQNDIDINLKRLNYHGINTKAIHGNSFGKERRNVLTQFRDGTITLLLASDLASRGLDIKDLTYIINLDVPENPTFYLHRCGRVGRMGRKGISITIATDREVSFIKKYEKKYCINIMHKKMSYGNIVNYGKR